MTNSGPSIHRGRAPTAPPTQLDAGALHLRRGIRTLGDNSARCGVICNQMNCGRWRTAQSPCQGCACEAERRTNAKNGIGAAGRRGIGSLRIRGSNATGRTRVGTSCRGRRLDRSSNCGCGRRRARWRCLRKHKTAMARDYVETTAVLAQRLASNFFAVWNKPMPLRPCEVILR
jgi:hypothetical protein